MKIKRNHSDQSSSSRSSELKSLQDLPDDILYHVFKLLTQQQGSALDIRNYSCLCKRTRTIVQQNQLSIENMRTILNFSKTSTETENFQNVVVLKSKWGGLKFFEQGDQVSKVMEVWLKNSSDIRSVSFIKKDIKELSDIFKDRHKPKTTLRANSTSTLKDLGMTNGQSYLEKPNFFSIR